MGRRARNSGFEIRDLLLGWSNVHGAFVTAEPELLEDASNEQLDCSVELTVAARNEAVGGRFTLTIATPEALLRRASPVTGVLADRATLLVSTVDWNGIRQHLASIVEQCNAPTFEAAVGYLNQYFKYEYDDFSWTEADAVRDRGYPPLQLRDVRTRDGRALRSLYPGDDAEVNYSMHMLLGHGAADEQLAYDFRIVSPQALAIDGDDRFRVLSDHGALVVCHFDWRDILAHLKGILSKCEAERLAGCRELLERYFSQATP